jgi:hypothetical protein
MTFLPHKPAPFNRVSAANRLPDHTSLMLTARTIERRYNVSPGMAQIVAELVVGASIEARQ